MLNVLRIAALRRYVSAYALVTAAGYFSFVALSLLVYDRTSSALAVAGVLIAAEVLPGLFAPFIVATFDRWPSRVSIALSYGIQAVSYATLAVLVVSDIDGAQLVVACIIAAFIEGASMIVGRSLLRAAVIICARDRELEREANAILNLAMGLGQVGGPILAGVVIAIADVAAALGACAALLAVATLVIATFPTMRTSGEDDQAEAPVQRLAASLRYVRSERPALGILLLVQVAAIAFFTLAAPVEIVLVRNLGGDAAQFGILLTSWGLGALGSAALYSARPGGSLPVMLALSTLALGLGFALMGLAPVFALAYAGAFVAGTGNGVQWITAMSLIQEATPDDQQARVVSLLESGAAIAPAVGFLLGGLLASISPQLALLVAAAAIALLTGPLYIAATRAASLRIVNQGEPVAA